jgi:PleD family two-component response regulator
MVKYLDGCRPLNFLDKNTAPLVLQPRGKTVEIPANIFIVDDEASIRDMLSRWLSEKGYSTLSPI